MTFLAGAFAATSPWREALPGYRYEFPRDHFDHPAFRTEWWYYTGNVHDEQGRRFGFELVFFRQGERRGSSNNASAWRIDDLYLAHAAVTDIDGRRFCYRERLNRGGPGIAGVSIEKQRIWNGNWSSQWSGERQVLDVTAEGFSFHLQLTPQKPLIIHGENGVSQKAQGAGKASYYVSFPRLAVSGRITVSGTAHEVTGVAWMDHEWFSHQLAANQTGWDWFSIQLDNGTELMLFELRRKDGSIDPSSSGTFIGAHGRPRHLTSRDFSLMPVAYWTSAQTKTRYPVQWRVAIPTLNITLDCRAALDSQELVATHGGPSYWEGAVSYSGTANGVGYLEMTGYNRPMSLN